MTPIQLQFERLESHWGTVWKASIPGFRDYYAVMVERETGKTKTIDPKAQKTYHNSVEEAKQWCQRDFEERALSLIATNSGEREIKRFMVFEEAQFYPSGGLSDCRISFDTADEAVKYCEENPYGDSQYVWDRIMDKDIY